VCFHPTSSSLKTPANRFNNLDQSPSGGLLWTRFRGMTRSKSPSLHAILMESASKDDSSSSEGESYDSPLPRACGTVIPVRARTPYTITGGNLGVPGSSSEATMNRYINNPACATGSSSGGTMMRPMG
jgi:hypothetical protein